jgi:hypothetical protein
VHDVLITVDKLEKTENNRTSTSAENVYSLGILLFERKKGAEIFDAKKV